jgi:hypothetical protein
MIHPAGQWEVHSPTVGSQPPGLASGLGDAGSKKYVIKSLDKTFSKLGTLQISENSHWLFIFRSNSRLNKLIVIILQATHSTVLWEVSRNCDVPVSKTA